MGTFATGSGQTGFASEGFRNGGGVTQIKTGAKYNKGRIIYKKNSAKKKSVPINKKEEPSQYNLESSTGQEVKVMVQPKSSYPGVRVAQNLRGGNLSTEQANRLAQNYPELAGNPNRRYIAVSGEDVNRTNQSLGEAGYNNAGELLNAINRGEVKVNPDKTLTINKPTTTMTETTTTTTPGQVPPPQEAVEYLNKNYFGVTDYFTRLQKSGIQEQGSALYNIYTNKKLSREDIIGLTEGKIRFGLGTAGQVVSSVFEPIVYSISQKRRYDQGIPEAEVQSGIYEPIIQKEKEQTIFGVFQLSALTQGITIRPGEAVPVNNFPELKREPFEYIKPYETPISQRDTIFYYGDYTLRPKESVLSEKDIIISYGEGRGSLPSITGGIAPEIPGSSIQSGLKPTQNELNILKIDFSKSTKSGAKTITYIEPTEAPGIQSQLKANQGQIVIGRYGTEAEVPTISFDNIAVNSVKPSELPTPKEIKTVYERQFNGKLTISAEEMTEPETIPQYKRDLYKYLTETTEKVSSVTPSEVIKVNIDNAGNQKLLSEFKPIKISSTKENIPILSEDVIVIETSKGKYSLFGGSKKGQAVINPGGELNIETGGKVYEIYGGNEFERFITSPGGTEINNGGKTNIFTPVVIRSNINFNNENKDITSSITRIKIVPGVNNDINTGIRSEIDTGQRTGTGSRSGSRIRNIPIVDLSTETIQEQENIPPIYPRLTFKPYQPERPEPKQPTTPPELPKMKIDNQMFKKENINGGFNVFVRQKGVFQKINQKPLNLKKAFGLGAERVEKTPAVSFKIIPSNKSLTSPGITNGLFSQNLSIRNGGLFVEKRSRRINTPGEIRGITWKGIRSKKIKKIFG